MPKQLTSHAVALLGVVEFNCLRKENQTSELGQASMGLSALLYTTLELPRASLLKQVVYNTRSQGPAYKG